MFRSLGKALPTVKQVSCQSLGQRPSCPTRIVQLPSASSLGVLFFPYESQRDKSRLSHQQPPSLCPLSHSKGPKGGGCWSLTKNDLRKSCTLLSPCLLSMDGGPTTQAGPSQRAPMEQPPRCTHLQFMALTGIALGPAVTCDKCPLFSRRKKKWPLDTE